MQPKTPTNPVVPRDDLPKGLTRLGNRFNIELIFKYRILNQRAMNKPNPYFNPPLRPVRRQAQYDQFEASALYCPKCRQAMPVRKRLLLVLPEGDKYEYLCAACFTTVGDKIERNTEGIKLVLS